MDDIRDFHWTSTGASHLLKGKVCEDASLSISTRDYAIAAVADGHGAAYCYRSSLGAKMAVETAWRSLQMFMQEARGEDIARDLENEHARYQLYYKLATLISHTWQQETLKHLEENPVTFQEVERNHLYLTHTISDMNSCLVYGSTLLFAAMNQDILLLGQQGDGRICVLYADGTMNMPVPWDARCVNNVTTSLCDNDVDTSMRFALIDLKKKPVAALFLVSDGIEDSFENFAQMYDFLLELLDLYYHDRRDFERQLANRLDALSARGSRDDISIAGFIHLTWLKKILHQLERKVRFNKNKAELEAIRQDLEGIKMRQRTEMDTDLAAILDSVYQMGLDTYSRIRQEMNEAFEDMKKGEHSG